MAFDLLMGYAVAHEVGHCLLGPGHSYAELMRGAWNRKEPLRCRGSACTSRNRRLGQLSPG
jgi:hypothetical protein